MMSTSPGTAIDGIEPALTNDGTFELLDARHPLLARPVPVTIKVTPPSTEAGNVRHGLTISRPDVAHLMLTVLQQPETVRHSVGVAY